PRGHPPAQPAATSLVPPRARPCRGAVCCAPTARRLYLLRLRWPASSWAGVQRSKCLATMTPSALPRSRHHPPQGTTLARSRLLLTLCALLPEALASAQSPGPPGSSWHTIIGLSLIVGAV